ncbi:MAG: S9 family peptidase [Bacteroidales bacterium]|nr:S9 family peptidase [Bacteroidales bacterium]
MQTKTFLLLFLLFSLRPSYSQNITKDTKLSIEKIMQDPKWMGTSPSNFFWSEKGDKFYFNWNPENEDKPSLYSLTPDKPKPDKVSKEEEDNLPSKYGTYNKAHTKKLYSKNGDLFLVDIATGEIRQLSNTLTYESSPGFNFNEDKVLYISEGNLFTWDIDSGIVNQLTDFVSGTEKPALDKFSGEQATWLHEQQLELFNVLQERKEKKDKAKKEREDDKPQKFRKIYTGDARASDIKLSPDGKYITWVLRHSIKDAKRTIVPNYVTESGYTEDIKARSKVGSPHFSSVDLYIYNRKQDTIIKVTAEAIPGIKEPPVYLKDYDEDYYKDPKARNAIFSAPVWSENGENAVINILSADNKDRWIMLLNLEDGSLKLIDKQHDEAWIGGPGIGWWGSTLGWMPDNKNVFFQSEESGYSHLYTVNIENGRKKALTKGNFEIYQPFISKDKESWYFSSNQAHSGLRNFYKMPVKGGAVQRLTQLSGKNDVYLSPDEKMIAIRFSTSNHPEELYLKKNDPEIRATQITNSSSEEFSAYPWRIPEFITFTARDGANIHARLYKPGQQAEQGPAVIFVHGAGYLQNAHQWWSSYFREYMFHNFLVDNGYTVLDIDYRGSAGYGRDWRTAIYRHMGGKDLSDQVDGANFLTQSMNVSAEKIGIYGGSYGGFITLMALFTTPDVFGAGAALRSVTDWAHYNHGYTANILNTPVLDSLAYIKSSPIYFAEGLKKPLLICHGMIDDNVHFQDVVRLTQRLIELGKDNWELAVYPLERHSFIEPSSWTDEYKRIFKLFEENLK